MLFLEGSDGFTAPAKPQSVLVIPTQILQIKGRHVMRKAVVKPRVGRFNSSSRRERRRRADLVPACQKAVAHAKSLSAVSLGLRVGEEMRRCQDELWVNCKSRKGVYIVGHLGVEVRSGGGKA